MGKGLPPRLELISEQLHFSHAVPSFGGGVQFCECPGKQPAEADYGDKTTNRRRLPWQGEGKLCR